MPFCFNRMDCRSVATSHNIIQCYTTLQHILLCKRSRLYANEAVCNVTRSTTTDLFLAGLGFEALELYKRRGAQSSNVCPSLSAAWLFPTQCDHCLWSPLQYGITWWESMENTITSSLGPGLKRIFVDNSTVVTQPLPCWKKARACRARHRRRSLGGRAHCFCNITWHYIALHSVT
jgi:hypothetical protein